MSDEGQPLKPEHIFKKLTWRSTVGLSETMEQATTWSITGIAAIVALFVSNLDSIAKLVAQGGLRWGLLLFTASLVAGALSKHVGMALTKGLQTIRELEGLLNSEQGQTLMTQMSISPKQLIEEIATPFFWPLSVFVRRGGLKGLTDYLATDKRFVRLFCIQLGFLYLHGLFAAAALIVLATSITR